MLAFYVQFIFKYRSASFVGSCIGIALFDSSDPIKVWFVWRAPLGVIALME
jgi:hypothetical protein